MTVVTTVKTQVGTEMKSLARKIKKAYIGVNGVAQLFMSSGKLAEEYAVGESVFLMENGSPVEYLVVHQGLPSSMYANTCDGIWLLRKDIWGMSSYDYSMNDYENADIQSYLIGGSSSVLMTFSKETQDSLLSPNIPYVEYNSGGIILSGLEGLQGRVFLLSAYELGGTTEVSSYMPIDGSCLSYFASNSNANRIAYFEGSATQWYLRSLSNNRNDLQWTVNSTGSFATSNVNSYEGLGIRPAVIINKETLFDDNNIIIGISGDNHATFNIDGIYYKVDNGMTWETWVNSSYNVDRFHVGQKNSQGTYNVCTCSGQNISKDGTTEQYSTDIIEVGGTYKFIALE